MQTTLPCGCVIIYDNNPVTGFVCSQFTKFWCAQHLAEQVIATSKRKAEEAQRMLQRLAKMEPLHCDYCGEAFGYVYDFDLNGSSFACKDCKEKI